MLTKSKILAWRQCPKRLWLETHGDRGTDSVRQKRGRQVGELARSLLGHPDSELIDREALDLAEMRARTMELLASGKGVFEAAFGDQELSANLDVVRPSPEGWALVEVKDSSSVKPHHRDDVAIQWAAAARSTSPERAIVAHIDTSWTYPGAGDYRGLFKETDLTEEVRHLVAEVDSWIAGAKATLQAESAPSCGTGRHCDDPYPCPFQSDCRAEEPQAEHPIDWLPGALKKAAKALRDSGAREMDDIPDDALSEAQLLVKKQTLLGEAFFDSAGAAEDLARCAYPLHFLDFETVNPAVPIWAGTQPYAQIPFQFSCHTLAANGTLSHREFLLASGEDPCRPFAEALLRELGTTGAVVVYNLTFERGRIEYLARRHPHLAERLSTIIPRMFDLQPVAKRRYYHPDQRGSWSIKKVLPCLVPELSYEDLGGVQDGEMAIEAYLELIAPDTERARRLQLEAELRRYCRLDTLGMVAIWARFLGSEALLRNVLAAATTPA